MITNTFLQRLCHSWHVSI